MVLWGPANNRRSSVSRKVPWKLQQTLGLALLVSYTTLAAGSSPAEILAIRGLDGLQHSTESFTV